MQWPEVIRLTRPLRDVKMVQGEQDRPPQVDWDARLQECEQAAYERGRLEGERALGEQLVRQRAEMLQLHQGVIDSLRQSVPRVIQDAEGALIALAIETAQKLVAGLPISAEMIEAVVREATVQFKESTEFAVFLHPDDLTLLQQADSPVLQPAPGAPKHTVHLSNEVTRGGCLVQTRFGVIDARRETKIEQIQRALTA